jgi:ketosteroid isomerase-like protein
MRPLIVIYYFYDIWQSLYRSRAWKQENNMRHILKISIVVFVFISVDTSQAAHQEENVLVQMFTWWNGAFKTKNSFTEENFARYFTKDAVIFINGQESVRGTGPIAEQFTNIQARKESVEIVLPFEESFESGNRIFTYHLKHARENGVDKTSHVMGYAVIEDGKIALANNVSLATQSILKMCNKYEKGI